MYLKCTYFILKHIYMIECMDVFVYLFCYFNKYGLEKNKPSTIQGLFCSSFLFHRKRKREKKGSYLGKFWWICFVLGNMQKGWCHFNSLVLSFTIIFKVIFLVVAPEIIFIIFYIYLYSCLYQCFLCLLCRFELLYSVLSFQPEGLRFVLCRTHLSIFVYLGMS